MAIDDEGCADAARFQHIDAAFRAGDLDALRAAVPDPSLVPNGDLGDAIGMCLVYAIYHSPFAFIRTPLEMAQAAGLTEIAAILAQNGQPLRRRLRPGLTLLVDIAGTGAPVRRQHHYQMRLRLWADGVPFRWTPSEWAPPDVSRLEEDGLVLVHRVLINRGRLINGLFYGVDGMRVGGTRRLEIAPHLAYGATGVHNHILPGATLTAEVTILELADDSITNDGRLV